MLPTLRSRITAFVLPLAVFTEACLAQTTLHSIPVSNSWDVRSLGDLDGDGVADFGVTSPGAAPQLSCTPGAGVIHVYSGRTGAELYSRGSPTSAGPWDGFGWAIDGVGDVNGDARSDYVVGAPLWSSIPNQCGEGRAFICSGVDGSVLRTLVGPGSAPGSYQLFGRCVAGIGDANADGVPDVAVGSEYGINAFGVQSGYVCIFSGFDGSIIHTLYGNWNVERFGTCCAAGGDVNGDGYADVLVGTPYAIYGGNNGGVRCYSGFDGLLLNFNTGTASITIGYGVASTDDLDGDGVPDFVTGAIASGTPCARVCSGQSGGLIFTLPAQPTIPGGGQPAPFPHPVGGVGDVDGDGIPDVATCTQTGIAVYSGANGALVASHQLPAGLSASVGPATDLNGDGHADYLCGSWNAPSTYAEVILTNCPVPAAYCTGKLNSVGCAPSMTSSGVLSLTVGNDDFRAIGVSVLNHTNGMLLWSTNQNSVPFHGGTLCIGPGIQRTPIQNSGGTPVGIDCSGSFSYNFTRSYVSGIGVQPGARLYTQYWSRDPGYSPPNNISLTNGLAFTVCP